MYLFVYFIHIDLLDIVILIIHIRHAAGLLLLQNKKKCLAVRFDWFVPLSNPLSTALLSFVHACHHIVNKRVPFFFLHCNFTLVFR